MLQELECDLVQGYLYSKPLPMDELSAYLLRGSISINRLPASNDPEKPRLSVVN
jgi:hypothetical protein